MISVFWNSRKSTGSVDRTPTHNTHLCSTVCSEARNAHHALGSRASTAQELHCHLCAPEKSLVIWCVKCLIHGCSLTCHSPRALPLPHSLVLLLHKNTQHNRYNKSNSENTQCITHISKLPQSTSCALKNYSGVKTCRVAETRAPQHPQSTDFAEVWSSVSVGGKLGPPTSARNRDAGENERKTPTPDATNRHRERKSKSEKKNDARDDTGRRKEVEQKRTVSAQRRKDMPARNKNMTTHKTRQHKSCLIAGPRG